MPVPGVVAETMEVPFLGEVPMNPEVRVNADNGMPIVVADPVSAEAVAFFDITHKITNAICQMSVSEALGESSLPDQALSLAR